MSHLNLRPRKIHLKTLGIEYFDTNVKATLTEPNLTNESDWAR